MSDANLSFLTFSTASIEVLETFSTELYSCPFSQLIVISHYVKQMFWTFFGVNASAQKLFFNNDNEICFLKSNFFLKKKLKKL